MNDIKTTVLYNRQMAPGYYCLGLATPGFSTQAQAGQFVMLRINSGYDPLLRRPFGIFRTGKADTASSCAQGCEYTELVYKVVGRGTRMMTQLKPGDEVGLLGPLGQGFCVEKDLKNALLVGGGIGVVPLFMLARQLVEAQAKVRLLLGGRSCNDILAVTEFERLGVETYVATDDGTLGEEGLVTQVLERKLDKYPDAAVFACGPTPMLQAVQQICAQRGVSLQVSLEALMACGVGACLGCVVPGSRYSQQHPEYLCTCKQGPVFNADALSWPQQEDAEGEERI